MSWSELSPCNDPAPVAKLEFRAPSGAFLDDSVFFYFGDCVVGSSSSCDVVLDGESIEGTHARFTSWRALNDLIEVKVRNESKKGALRVDMEPVGNGAEVLLPNNAVIHIGDMFFAFVVLTDEQRQLCWTRLGEKKEYLVNVRQGPWLPKYLYPPLPTAANPGLPGTGRSLVPCPRRPTGKAPSSALSSSLVAAAADFQARGPDGRRRVKFLLELTDETSCPDDLAAGQPECKAVSTRQTLGSGAADATEQTSFPDAPIERKSVIRETRIAQNTIVSAEEGPANLKRLTGSRVAAGEEPVRGDEMEVSDDEQQETVVMDEEEATLVPVSVSPAGRNPVPVLSEDVVVERNESVAEQRESGSGSGSADPVSGGDAVPEPPLRQKRNRRPPDRLQLSLPTPSRARARKRATKSTTKSSKKEEEEEEAAVDGPPEPPPSRARRGRTKKAATKEEEEEEQQPTQARARRGRSKKTAIEEEEEEDMLAEEDGLAQPTQSRARRGRKVAVAETPASIKTRSAKKVELQAEAGNGEQPATNEEEKENVPRPRTCRSRAV